MIDEILLFLAKKVGHAGGGEHIYIYIYVCIYTHDCVCIVGELVQLIISTLSWEPAMGVRSHPWRMSRFVGSPKLIALVLLSNGLWLTLPCSQSCPFLGIFCLSW